MPEFPFHMGSSGLMLKETSISLIFKISNDSCQRTSNLKQKPKHFEHTLSYLGCRHADMLYLGMII